MYFVLHHLRFIICPLMQTENWANLVSGLECGPTMCFPTSSLPILSLKQMYACIDSVGVDMQPQRNRNPIYGLLWLVVMVRCPFWCCSWPTALACYLLRSSLGATL